MAFPAGQVVPEPSGSMGGPTAIQISGLTGILHRQPAPTSKGPRVAFVHTLSGRVLLFSRTCAAGAELQVLPNRAISAAIVDLPPVLFLF